MKKLERFILRDILSDGPAGTVYKSDEVLPGDNRRTVALKVLPLIEGALTGESPTEERFFGEVRVLAQLAVHPNLATVRYASPEMLSSEFGRVGPASDLYALGHIAYEMALGAKLHRQQFPAVFEGNSGKDPAPNKWMMWHASIGMQPAAITSVREF